MALDVDQAAPVQNTWYTFLQDRNIVLYALCARIATTGETLELRITIDGEVFISSGVAVNANEFTGVQSVRYSLMGEASQYINCDASGGAKDVTNATNQLSYMQGRSVKVECRKTTANGAGTLSVRGIYGKW